MRACLLTQRARSRSVGPLTAATVLRMATLNGARALGLDQETGSIEVGKAADLVLLDVSRSRHQPVRDPVATVVHACCADDVVATVIDGRTRYLRDAR
jgi:5-methylthioadenosine/S-adenosylhomocysteine deaminase